MVKALFKFRAHSCIIVGMAKIDTIPYPALSMHYSPVFRAYLADGLPSCFRHDFRDKEVLILRAREAARRRMAPEVLQAVRRYSEELEAPEAVLRNIGYLEEGKACAVIAGQQPGLATGPMFTIYKAITTIRLARWLTEQSGIPAVPIFWNHSDDHDLSEIRDVTVFDRDEGLRLIRLAIPGSVGPIYEVNCPDAIDSVIQILLEAMPPTDFKPEVEAVIRATKHARPALWFSRLLTALFGSYGMLVVEPRLLDSAVTEEVYRRVLGDPDGVEDAFAAGRRMISNLGLPDSLGDVGFNLFSIFDGRRERVIDIHAVKGRLSAGAGLRLIVQDRVFPTAAVVVGPNELAYGSELRPLYDYFGMDQPVFFPRISVTLVEPRMGRTMDRHGLSLSEILNPHNPVAKDDLSHHRLLADLELLRNDMERRISEMAGSMTVTGPEVQTARDKTVRKIREALEAFQMRLIRFRRQGGMDADSWQRLENHLRPRGGLQERTINLFSFLGLRGRAWLGDLVETLDPFSMDHQVVKL